MNDGGGQKRAARAVAPGCAATPKRPRTTKAQELRDAQTKQQIAQRHARSGSFDAVPTFAGAKTKAAAARAPPRPAPLTPVHHYNFRQRTPPPSRLRAGHSNSIAALTAAQQPPPGPTAKLSALAARMRAAISPQSIEQTVCRSLFSLCSHIPNCSPLLSLLRIHRVSCKRWQTRLRR